MTKKVVIALTSYNEKFYSDGKKTGVFVVEALHPFQAFKEAGYAVTFVSETGNFGYDEHSLEKDFLNGKDLEIYEDLNSDFNKHMNQVKKASSVNAEDFDIFFASAGHGTLFDYPKAKAVRKLATDIYANNGVLAAVCHGPVIFDQLLDPKTGKPLIEGKAITGFTDVGEKLLNVDDIMASKGLLSVEDIAKKENAKYLAPNGPWDDFSITDGKIVTGVNPASAHSTALRSINLVS